MSHDDDDEEESDRFWQRFWEAHRARQFGTCLEILIRRRSEKRSEGGSAEPLLVYLHADVLRELGNYGQSQSMLKPMEIDDPRLRAHAEVSLGQSSILTGKFDEAERWFRAAVKSDPSSPGAWIWLSTMLARREDWNEAMKVLRQGLSTVTACRDDCISI